MNVNDEQNSDPSTQPVGSATVGLGLTQNSDGTYALDFSAIPDLNEDGSQGPMDIVGALQSLDFGDSEDFLAGASVYGSRAGCARPRPTWKASTTRTGKALR
jgi:hypothetical protein